MAGLDIFNAQKSVIANGLEGKVILIYGGNNLGKSAQATRFPKPFVIAAEMGLNGIDGIPYAPVTRWSDFKTLVRQFTGPTKDKARELYSTIIIDEVYATSIYCQDYVCSTFGDGALTMADGDSRHNLYQLYEKEYFRQINTLTNAGYTIVFIAHAQQDSQTKFITPKGDKRCMNPIIDKCDYVVYLKSNGVDAEGHVIKSSAYLAQTNEFFATENLSAAIQEGIDKKRELDNAVVTSFEEQQKMNTVAELDFPSLVTEFNNIIANIEGSTDINETTEAGKHFKNYWAPKIVQITEKYLGKGGRVGNCNENQVEAISLIVADLKELVKE